jgi:hypothetical protein
VQRLELTRVTACERCGRGRAELTADAGEVLAIALDPAVVLELRDGKGESDVPWLSSLVVDLAQARGETLREVVIDAGAKGLRGLVTLSRGEGTDVFACSVQEGLVLAVRGSLPLYATTEALAAGVGKERRGGDRLH